MKKKAPSILLAMILSIVCLSLIIYSVLPKKEGQGTVGEMTIDFIGDSLTYGGKWDRLFPDKHIVNRGIPGDQVSNVLRRILPIVYDRSSQAFIMLGTNDLNKKKSIDEISKDYKMLVRTLKWSGTKEIYIVSVLPINDSLLKSNRKNEDIILLNNKLQGLARQLNVTFIDMHGDFLDEKKQLRKEFTYDGLHLNETGYAVWKYRLEKYVH